jgi:hypothetical protein
MSNPLLHFAKALGEALLPQGREAHRLQHQMYLRLEAFDGNSPDFRGRPLAELLPWPTLSAAPLSAGRGGSTRLPPSDALVGTAG